MMDISMYGNHASHSSGFQNDGAYPHYFSATHHHHHHLQSHQNVPIYTATAAVGSSSAISVQTGATSSGNNFYSTAAVAHPHLYSPSAIEYGIHTTSSNNSPSDQYYEHGSEGYFSANANNNSGSPENHIISSDNGLSYTNLDYIAYQQAHASNAAAAQCYAVDDKIHLPHHYSEEMIMSGSQTNPLHQHHHHHHHTAHSNATVNNPWHHPNTSGNYNISGSAESGNLVSNQMQAISGNNLQNQQQQQQIQQPQIHSPNSIQSTSPTLQSQQQQQQLQSEGSCSQQTSQQAQNIPTYKWMQVKRAQTKPSEYFISVRKSLNEKERK
jgi:homeobox protein HoxA/B/D1